MNSLRSTKVTYLAAFFLGALVALPLNWPVHATVLSRLTGWPPPPPRDSFSRHHRTATPRLSPAWRFLSRVTPAA